jgi:hypothetical protein
VPLDTQRQRRAEASREAMAATRFRKLRRQKGTQRTQWTHEHIRTTQTRECYATPPAFSATPPRQTRSNTKRGPETRSRNTKKGPIWDSNQEVEEKRRRSLEEEEKKRRRRRGGRARFGYVFSFFSSSFLLLLQPPSKSSVRACSCPILAGAQHLLNCEQRLRFNLT